MLRDLKFFRRNPTKNPLPEASNENLHSNPPDLSHPDSDPSRPPLNTIQDPISRAKPERISSKHQISLPDPPLPFRTPEKAAATRSKFGWGSKIESATNAADSGDDSTQQGSLHLPPLIRGGLYGITTPRTYRTGGKASSVHSDTSSTQSTPTKSVSKPPCSGFSSNRPPLGMGARTTSFSAASKGMPMLSAPLTAFSVAEVPHFELKEDPSFWLDHNVQVVIRARPLNNTEKNLQGNSRCLKQESAQCVTWIGQPETRFTFDYVACETTNQEMLFRVTGLPMVENCMSGYNCCMFAYGQTGSGKTYTMLGEIDELEIKPNTDRGMTPRIFEFLFARIRAEEESRRDEKLKYSCKCSFLEIYNEQITDLLDPMSTNLLLREDLRKGVYVENLSEFEVETVNDILKLLIQGAANRKVAATNMNRESSRSHSVFTCVIESRWEKDSAINLRFARLNLVDLAGSERQKSSGAEGERLKEAANINKSLSTLGHVIMILADVAHGKQRHIPYRDSRLTFLLQDSLGGNSKTIIMANVSSSICSANETLSTLKFAQRAKLIQNNAVVNEDTSGDIVALQHQIRLLKDELSVLKRQNVTRSLSFRSKILEDPVQESFEISASEKLHGRVEMNVDEFQENEAPCSIRVSTKQLQSLEATLAGALRREKMADTTIKQLEAEIEQLNRLVRQREEDTQCSKMKLRFREDKIHRMEALVDGLVPTETYLMEENTALSEEIQLLRTRVDRNPEVTRFALENIRLLDQLRGFQDFYEEGERELLLAEVSELRNQLIHFFDSKSEQVQYPKADKSQKAAHPQFASLIKENDPISIELKRTCHELEECRKNLNSCLEANAKLTREMNTLRTELNDIKSSPSNACHHVNIEPDNLEFYLASSHKDPQVQAMKVESEFPIKLAEETLSLQLELDILKTILGEEKSSRVELEERAIHADRYLEVANETIVQTRKHNEDLKNELKDTKSVLEAIESQHILSLIELDDLRDCNNKYADILKKQEQDISILRKQLDEKLTFAREEIKDQSPKQAVFCDSPLRVKLRRMQVSVEKACSLNMRYQSDPASKTSIEQEMEEVRSQVELETAEVIVCLQEELMSLQQQVNASNKTELLAKQRLDTLEAEIKELSERISLLTSENGSLCKLLEEKENDVKSLTEDWEKFSCEIADVLANGNAALEDASYQISSMSDSFPQRAWISEKVGRMIRSISERDASIKELQNCLEDAQTVRCDMEWKLRSLRGATLAITEAQQQETSERDREILLLTSQLSERDATISELESRINELEEESFEKDALLENHTSLHPDVERQIQSLQLQLEQSQKRTAQLKHAQELEQAHALEHKLQKEEEDTALSKIADDVLKAKRVVDEIKSIPNVVNEHSLQSLPCGSIDNPGKNLHGSECGRVSEDTFDREKIVFLLRKEIESALESLKDVQDKMFKLFSEREEIKKSEMECRKSMEQLCVEVLRLKSDIMHKEQQFESRLLELEHKLQTVEGNAVASNECFRKAKEVFELEISDAKSVAAQKTDEASNLLKKIEEAQETMKDADIMINTLVEANESAKLEIERFQKIEAILNKEKNYLSGEVQDLKSSLARKEQEYNYMRKSFHLNLTETRSLVLVLDEAFRHAEATYTEKFKLITCDLDWLKDQFHHYTELARTWLEDIWSDIIGKDCAVSVLHLCHMGILLERITGLNVENGFLYRGLCESNTVIDDLREHNVRVKKELEMCSLLKGKLLLDINNNFNRITKKEDETAELKARLNSFEKKIIFLHLQEESMLARSNSFGTELAILMKELDAANRNALKAVSVKEKLFGENEELHKQLKEEKGVNEMLRNLVREGLDLLSLKSDADSYLKIGTTTCNMSNLIESQTESILRNMFAKDFELLVLASELELKNLKSDAMAIQIVELGRHRDIYNEVIERMKKEIVLLKITGELKKSEVCSLLVDTEELKVELLKLKEVHSQTSGDLQEAKLGLGSFLNHANLIKQENHKLQGTICSLEACITSLQSEVDRKRKQLEEILCSHTAISTEFDLKKAVVKFQAERIDALEAQNDSLQNEVTDISKELDLKKEVTKIQVERINALEVETVSLKSEANTFNQKKDESITQILTMALDRISHITDDRIAWLMNTHCQEILAHKEIASRFVDILDNLALSAKELLSEKLSLQFELSRKDEVLKGLVFDLSLLQETASIAKDQKDELAEMAATFQSVKDELDEAVACRQILEGELVEKNEKIATLQSVEGELDEAVARIQKLKAELMEKNKRISALELDLAENNHKLNLVSTENLDLKVYIDHIVEVKKAFEQDLRERNKVTERLEDELITINTLLGKRNLCLQDLQNDMDRLADERDRLDSMVLILKEQLEMAQALAEENEAIATEARQIAEEQKAYAKDKEEEVSLLERSVEELECTVNALENKVEIVKQEAERQWFQTEELQMELEGGKIDISRNLKEAQLTIQFLQKELADKDAEIIQCKEHISELNMHAESQAREYKQKFMELEAMARQVKAESAPPNAANLTSSKAEKSAAKTRGSGSPFKCIGLGITQQINSEKDEELTSARCQIEELEALAASRQKEIFMLNTRLAAAESMTHDVIRDLLGVKLDMANYASLLDHQQTNKEKETTRFNSQELQEKEKEVSKLKQQLNEFIEERRSWLDEINERHTEMMNAQILSEKRRQQEQFLTAENDILKADTAKYKKIVIELEDKLKKLTGQQNLQQRINHHAKTKEENSLLKIQNKELNSKQERSDLVLSRVREELADYRASNGKKPYPDIDIEGHLRKKLSETEEERIQLAQKLLTLCTGILKVAGLSQPASCINPTAAEDALDQIEGRICALEGEVQNLKLQCRISCEKIRLAELKEQRFSSSDEEFPSPNTLGSPCVSS